MKTLLLLLPLLWLVGCDTEPGIARRQAYVFGTLVEVSVAEKRPSDAAIAEVLARFDTLHRMLHAWQPSELSRLNAALARGEKFSATPALLTILRDAQALSVQTGELFNPAIGQLIALWGFQSDTPATRVPDAAAIRERLAQAPSMRDLRFDGARVWSTNPAVQIDLGGYAKGLALDEAARTLKRHGIRNALVNIGGNVLALGQNGARPWRVGVQHPRAPGTLAELDLHDGEAIGTSGDYQRYFEVGGVRYCHVLDPASGQPARGMQSVTIVVGGARAGVRSDVLSKPLFIAGPKQLETHAARLHLVHYLAVDADGRKHVSPALAARLR